MNSDGSILFSIIIPTYNRGERIKNTLLSVLDQDFKNYEVIIVDDGSTDNTEEIIKSFESSRLHYFKKENAERAAARNYGADRAKGQYITFLDSDDILYPFFLKNAHESLEKNNYPSFLHIAYEIKEESGRVLEQLNSISSDTFKFLIHGNPLSCIGAIVRKEDFLRFKFNEDRGLTLSEDWELWLRLVANLQIKTDNRISAAMIDHGKRSVLSADEEKLLARKTLSFKYAFADKGVQHVFGKYLKKMKSYFDLYISLHLALANKKGRALHYLKSAMIANPVILFDRRFYAIIKHLIF
jgi:glycosyltransferase involved in cell wall biosynthesis